MTAENRLRNAGWGTQRAQELAKSMADLTPRQQHAIVNMALAKPIKRSSARPLPGQRDRVQQRIDSARAQNVQTISKAMGADQYDRDSSGRFAVNEARGTEAQALDPRPPAQSMQEQLRNPFLARLGNKTLANPYRNPFESLRPQGGALQVDAAKWNNLRAQGQQPNWELLKAPKTAESFQQAMLMDDRFKQLGEKLATGEAFNTLAKHKDARALFTNDAEMFKAARTIRTKKHLRSAKAKKQQLEEQTQLDLASRRYTLGDLLGRKYGDDLDAIHDLYEAYVDYGPTGERPAYADMDVEELDSLPMDERLYDEDSGVYQYEGLGLNLHDSFHLTDANVAYDQTDLLVDAFSSGNFEAEIEVSFTDRDGRLVLSGTAECPRHYTVAQVVKLLDLEVVEALQNLASHNIEFSAITRAGEETSDDMLAEITEYARAHMASMYDDPLYWDKKADDPSQHRDLNFYAEGTEGI